MPPFILDMRPDVGGDILVTWSLPGLARATVRTPALSWLDGEHLRLASALVAAAQPVGITADKDHGHDDGTEQQGGTDYPGDY